MNKADSLKHYSLEQLKGVRNKNEEYGPILAQTERMSRGRAPAAFYPSLLEDMSLDDSTAGAGSTLVPVA